MRANSNSNSNSVRPAAQAAFTLVASVLLTALSADAVLADVFGRLKFSVKNAADEKPVVGARITLKDGAGVRPTVTLTTGPDGSILTAPLDARVWKATTEADTFTADSRDVTVVADTTNEVEVLLEPLTEKVIKITTARQAVTPSQTGSVTKRDQDFSKRFPTNAGNPQSLPDLIRSTPGVAANSTNQLHPRGEHSSTAIIIDGFYLPGALQGRAGQILVPSTIRDLKVLTGGFAPEYGGETAAILDVGLRTGRIERDRQLQLQGGSFSTFFGGLTFGGQTGKLLEKVGSEPNAEGGARSLRYFFDFTGRRTRNALEAPQPDRQQAHNLGSGQSFFGHFNLKTGAKDELSLVLNHNPAYTQVANRTGLPGEFRNVGQGFGYGGELSREEARALGIRSQHDAGQDVNQRDLNSFGVLTWRRQFSDASSGVFSLGGVTTELNVRNGNPAVDLANLPADSSIEFGPTVLRQYTHIQPQGSFSVKKGSHNLKAGFLYDYQDGEESYRFVPGSQIALNALAALDRRLVGSGSFQVDGMGNPVLDRRGNQVYQLDQGAGAPTLNIDRTGYYAAGFLQDFWNVSSRFTVNYGVRADFYRQRQSGGQNTVDSGALSPRINLGYSLDPQTIARASYNRLFVQPPLAQGAILGQAIKPQTGDQYELSLERELMPRHLAKFAYYFKNLKNVLDTGLMLDGTQVGAFSTVSLDAATIRGWELSYELLPREGKGWSAYFNYSQSRATPSGFTNTGEPVEEYLDHDQRHTVNFGASYALKNGLTSGINLYYGSGVASSVLTEGGARTPRTLVNFSLSTGEAFEKKRGLGLTFAVENLFDDRSVINFASPFSGTRFQPGRRFLLSATAKF